ncbi:RIP metalloprotease RseP [Candidatus Peregrinibacteria bacterium]|nr:RIP metalloprotease RseP [Candidatus Peregrinibacteria bacterium]
MNYIFTAIVFILILSVLVLAHELGHFIMARRAGIKVEEFGFGLPPRIWGKKKGETIYSVNWIPFGGFVRMKGEDGNKRSFKDERSFAAKPLRARVKVVLAGVFMNFLLAWILLTVGFSFGMQPLFSPGDILPAVDSGRIHLAEGLKIKAIEPDGVFAKVGMKADDLIILFNGKIVTSDFAAKFLKDPTGVYKVKRDKEVLTYEIKNGAVSDGLAIKFYDFASFPRVGVFGVDNDSVAYNAGIRPGDIILKADNHNIYYVDELESIIRGKKSVEYEIYRNGGKEKMILNFNLGRRVIISEVLPDSSAEKIGLHERDTILSVNGKEMNDSEELINFVAEHQKDTLAYLIDRNGERILYEVRPENGKIGVLLSELMNFGQGQGLSLYNVNLTSSIEKIDDEKYPFYVSVYKSFGEMVKMSKLTVRMFGGVVLDLAENGKVPETVAGPIGIAQMTHVFVQDGIIALIRFMAILSLSLAVINVLPIPALDGGRFLFLMIEFIAGRRVNQKVESFIHIFGYGLILLLIVAVTYGDIMKLVR